MVFKLNPKKVFIKFFFLIFSTFLGTTVFGQSNLEKYFKNIETVEQAQKLMESSPDLNSEIIYINTKVTNSTIEKKLFKGKLGEIYKIGKFDYKILSEKIKRSFRVSYIYLNGNNLSTFRIDSIRKIIISKYKLKIPFSSLVKQFSMDGNAIGDIGYFKEGEMDIEFENAIKQHKLGDVYTVDVLEKKWFYVVKKTHNDKEDRELVVFKMKSNS